MMLQRASKKTCRQNGYLQSLRFAEALQLPFLCPALYGPRNLSRTTTTEAKKRKETQFPIKTASIKATGKTFKSIPHNRRNLAFAAAAAHEPLRDDYIPFVNLTAPSEQSHRQRLDFSYPLPGLDARYPPLILGDAPSIPPAKFRSGDAIGGDLNEIHQALSACLQVGRFERAQALIRRLRQLYKPDAPGLIAAHNDYIREIALRIMRDQDSRLLKDLQHWFEVDLRGGQIPPNAVTLALMIQASSRGADSKAKDRTVRRYLHLAQEAEILDETSALVSDLDETIEAILREIEEEHSPEGPSIEIQKVDSSTTQSVTATDPPMTVRSVDQKGLGLSTLKRQLSIIDEGEDNSSTSSTFMREVEGESVRRSNFDRQLALEKNTVAAALDRWKEEDTQLRSHGVLNVLATKSVNAIMWSWHEFLAPAIREEIRKAGATDLQAAQGKLEHDRLQWSPYLQDVSPEKLSALSILTCIKDVSLRSKDDRGVKVLHVVRAIGASIQEEVLAKYTMKNKKYRQWRALSREVYLKKYGSDKLGLSGTGPSPSDNLNNEIADELERMEWPASVRVKVGAMLLSKIVEHTKVEVCQKDPVSGAEIRDEQPAFIHTFTYMGGKRIGVIRLNPALMEIMARAPLSPSLAKHLPMISKPKPWSGFREGGYLDQALPVVRLETGDVLAHRYALAASKNGDMSQVFKGLDVLAQTSWSINRKVFDVMVEAWNSGKEIASIPAENPNVDVPPEPETSAPLIERMKWLRKVKEAENYKGGLKTQRCFLNFQLEVARAFLKETLYFPHNVDFRGRAYPMAPFLNHMGADNARGLLQFAEKKILGPSGLRWLKIHLANLYGFDKASFEERQKFTEDHLPDIIDSATTGIHGKRWWLGAEDPWQCLAACVDLKAALDLPDPTRYRSQLAIHQDGTCNGLQHYAALGGDIAGAKQVNLEPGDRPSDIYTAVAEMVKLEINKDASNGQIIPQHLVGKVTRKVVKQTVMTNVYGVTFIGAKRQVRKQLDDILHHFPNDQTVNKDLASSYIAKKIFKSLAKMFNGAHDIQHWFGNCAGRICNSISPEQIYSIEREASGDLAPSHFTKKPLGHKGRQAPQIFTTGVIWTTPLKMPVVQSYNKRVQARVETSFQSINIHNPSTTDPVNRLKQLQAFPPNFIHSLDGTHMFLTALKSEKVGITFAAVHDSFWTHAGDVDTMNQITREAFIKMHSENIIERLRTEFETRYRGHICLTSVHYRASVGRKIRAWRKAQGYGDINTTSSPHRNTELLLEVKRLKLLSSLDEAERKEGGSMVTPNSIYEQSSMDERMSAPISELPVLLGQTNTRKAKFKANEELEVGDLKNVEPNGSVPEAASLVSTEDSVSDSNAEVIEEHDGDLEDVEGNESQVFTSNADGDILDHDNNAIDASSAANKLDASWIREAEERKREKARAHSKRNMKTYLWVPLTFPPVPKKVSHPFSFSLASISCTDY